MKLAPWFGYDFFISYSRDTAASYAATLAAELEGLNYTCFLDVEELPPGRPLTRTLRWALKRSAALIFIGTDRALASTYVQLELEIFSRRLRPIIPINVDGALLADSLADAHPWRAIQARDLVWIDETRAALQTHTPSSDVVGGIRRLSTFTRKRVIALRAITVVAVGFLAVSVLALQQACVAQQRATEARRQEQLAADNAARAQSLEQLAIRNAAEAERRSREATANWLALRSLTGGHATDVRVLLAAEAVSHTRRHGEPVLPSAVHALRQAIVDVGPIRLIEDESLSLTSIVSSRNERWLVAGLARNECDQLEEEIRSARLWDLSLSNPPAQARPLSGGFSSRSHDWIHCLPLRHSMAVSDDGRRVAVGSLERTYDDLTLLWDFSRNTTPKGPLQLKASFPSTSLALSPSGRWLMAGGGLYDLDATRVDAPPVPSKLVPHQNAERAFLPMTAAFTSDERWVFVWSSMLLEARALRDAQSDRRILQHALGKQGSRILGVAVSPSGEWVVSWSDEGGAWVLRRWEINASGPVSEWLLVKETFAGGSTFQIFTGLAVFSPDGRWLLSGVTPATTRIWRLHPSLPNWESRLLESGRPDRRSRPPSTHLTAAFSPNGRWLATALSDLSLWDLGALDPFEHPHTVFRGADAKSLAFSEDARWFATSGSNGRLWDLTAADPTANPIRLGSGGRFFMSPRGQWLVQATAGAPSLWPLELDDLFASAAKIAGRNFTDAEWRSFIPGQPYAKTFPAIDR